MQKSDDRGHSWVNTAGWLKAVRQPSLMKRNSQRSCQGVITITMMEPALSVMEKPRVQNRSNPKRLRQLESELWQDFHRF